MPSKVSQPWRTSLREAMRMPTNREGGSKAFKSKVQEAIRECPASERDSHDRQKKRLVPTPTNLRFSLSPFLYKSLCEVHDSISLPTPRVCQSQSLCRMRGLERILVQDGWMHQVTLQLNTAKSLVVPRTSYCVLCGMTLLASTCHTHRHPHPQRGLPLRILITT